MSYKWFYTRVLLNQLFLKGGNSILPANRLFFLLSYVSINLFQTKTGLPRIKMFF